MTACSTENILALMTDPRLRKLRDVADWDLLLPDDMAAFQMPDGYSEEEIWRIIMSIRKQVAVMVPQDPYREEDVWFVTTTALSMESKDLELRCKAGFPLDTELNALKGSPFLTRYLERTLSSAFDIEGIEVSRERIHGIFSGTQPMHDQIDKVINNYFQISADAESLAKREITQGLIETLYYRLIEGVDLDGVPRRSNKYQLDPRLIPSTSQECMNAVCRRVFWEEGDDLRYGPILRIINASWFFWNFEVFPCLNALVGTLLRNVIAIKWGYPVLTWIPVGYFPFGRYDQQRMDAVFKECLTDYGFGFDFSPFFSMFTSMYMHEVDRLEKSVVQLRKLNQLMEETFNFPMNDRQKTIISAICKEPHAPLRIGPYQKRFRVAYATARNDFLELEKEGFLVKTQEGKAFVFKAAPELASRIMTLGEAAFGSEK